MSSIEIKVPVLPESVADATIAAWHKKVGDSVAQDENILDLETDKVVLEVPSPEAGIITSILMETGTTVTAGQIVATVEVGAVTANGITATVENKTTSVADTAKTEVLAGPSARRTAAANEVAIEAVKGTGQGGRVTKDDVLNRATHRGESISSLPQLTGSSERSEERVPMSRLRARIAERLVESQQTAAILTTFNEINMHPVMELRKKYKDLFEKRHGVKLGFMSFFIKAVVEALKRFPAVNASIDGTDIIYHGYYDIGVAISSPRGLVVPILRNAEQMNMAGMEKAIIDYSDKAKNGKLSVEEMTGGTFTISNGGTFGSLLSTPIINPPQSGILGMHKIEERPVVENGQIVIRPMMYVALSYDHRMIDGRESVSFLVAVKELLEDPARLILDI